MQSDSSKWKTHDSHDSAHPAVLTQESLPDGWSSERFQVVEGDAGRVGLKSIKYNKLLG